jgi:superfamily II RNA helicase
MSGRAGRRGLDATGVVVIVCDKDEVPEVRAVLVDVRLRSLRV